MFIICEFISASVLCSAYPAAILLCMEWSEPKHRIIASALTISTHPIGLALTGVTAAYFRHFRLILRCIFGFGFIAAAFITASSESIRWLLVKGKLKRLQETIMAAADYNHLKLLPRTMDMIIATCEAKKEAATTAQKHENDISVFDLFKHKTLVWRFIIISFGWIATTFIVQGMSIISVSLHGDKYTNFIVVGLGGVPACFIVILLLRYVGRRKSIMLCMLAASATIIGTKLIPSNFGTAALMIFLLGRIFCAMAHTTVYFFTSELWPTSTRHTMMGLSSTFGRIGSAIAPLVPLLVRTFAISDVQNHR